MKSWLRQPRLQKLRPPLQARAELWQQVLERALSLPGVKVQRAEYLPKALARAGLNQAQQAAFCAGLYTARTDAAMLHKIDVQAQRTIRAHALKASALSAAAAAPGGLISAATIPADLLQYLRQLLLLGQKLAYLYGCPELTGNKGQLSSRGRLVLTVLCGVMFGQKDAISALNLLATLLKDGSLTEAQRTELKEAAIALSKDIAVNLGSMIGKELTRRGLSRLLPAISAVSAGTLTFYTFYPKARALQQELKRVLCLPV